MARAFPIILLLAFALGLLGPRSAKALPFTYHTHNVPLGRVLTNLQQRLAYGTNLFEITYYLARLHSITYATNLVEVPIRNGEYLPWLDGYQDKTEVPHEVRSFEGTQMRVAAMEHLTNAITLYESALTLLKKSTNLNEAKWMILPTELGLAWCLDQSGQKQKAIVLYRRALKTAWKLEVTGEFSFKEWLSDSWSDVRSGRNPLRRHNQEALSYPCYSGEIIGYLLQLLDPVKDASEIADLKTRQITLSKMGRVVSPILMALEPDVPFRQLTDTNVSVCFDLDGCGVQQGWAWITPKAGWLVFDPERSGRIDSALQMFGNVTFWVFWPNGYEALSALDDNQDGLLSGDELRGLAVWNDRNCDGVSDPGEVVPVEVLGIRGISCRCERDANGILWNAAGVVLSNGETRPTYDWMVPGR